LFTSCSVSSSNTITLLATRLTNLSGLQPSIGPFVTGTTQVINVMVTR
jgi:hypothetical protein